MRLKEDKVRKMPNIKPRTTAVFRHSGSVLGPLLLIEKLCWQQRLSLQPIPTGAFEKLSSFLLNLADGANNSSCTVEADCLSGNPIRDATPNS